MPLRPIALALTVFAAGCSSGGQPRIVQTGAASEQIVLTPGMATQIEMPGRERISSVAVGNTALVTSANTADVVSLAAVGPSGETNVIVRGTDRDGDAVVHQYRLVVGR